MGFFDFLKRDKQYAPTETISSEDNLQIKSINGQSVCSDPKTDPCGDGKYCEDSGVTFITLGQVSNLYTGVQSATYLVENCPPIAGILGKKTQAFLAGEITVTNRTGKGKGKEVNNNRSNYYRTLLKQPNYIQTQAQFLAQIYAFTQIEGFCLVYGKRAVGFPNEYSSLYVLPNESVKIEFNSTPLYNGEQTIKSIKYNNNGRYENLPIEDVVIIKDNSVLTKRSTNYVLPSSRLLPVKSNINNIIIAIETQGSIMENRGALGVLANTSDAAGIVPLKPEDKEALQKEWNSYGTRKGQRNIIITNAALKWQNIAMPTKDLMLFEGIQSDVKMICDVMDYPYHLLPYATEGTTFNNVGESGKQLFQNIIIPETQSIFEQLNYLLGTEEDNLQINYTYDHLPFLQKDLKAEAESMASVNNVYEILWQQGLTTRNEWLNALGMPISSNPDFDKKIYELPKDSQILASVIGVGGTQSLIQILSSNISDESKRGTLQVLFGLDIEQVNRMVQTNNNN